MDYIGVGGIIATLVVGILSCLITWLVAKKGITKKKLTYEVTVSPILSNNVGNVNKLKIYYGDDLLSEPHMLTVNIKNTGNCAILNPPIRILVNETDNIIPGYIEDIPFGYEKLWNVNRKDNQGTIELIHINKGQTVKARFYLDKAPKEEPKFVCPMEDVEIKKILNSDAYSEIINSVYDNMSGGILTSSIQNLMKIIRKII